jgi:peptide/nickel transport system permease protein
MKKNKIETPFQQFLSDYCENKVAVVALFVVCIILFIAIFAPLISPQNPYNLAEVSVANATLPPGFVDADNHKHILGTDDLGRDLLSAIFYGIRISLGVGVISGFFALAIGAFMGIISAFGGGKIDALIMRTADLFLGFPSFLIALILLAILGRGADKVVLALLLCQWANFARIVRGTAMVEREKEYISAAKCLALSKTRIVFRHLLPNCLPPLIVIATVNVAFSITLEASLSFLGVGLPITEPSLGLLIANGYTYIIRGKYWISLYPGIALLITVASINLVADQLRDVLNPRLKK